MKKLTLLTTSALLLMLLTSFASAGVITCGGNDRTASLGSAEICKTGSGNTLGNGSTVNALFLGDDWTLVGESTATGSTGYITTVLTDGNWNGVSVSGSWAIESSFWSLFDEALISIHVGNGQGDPDHFVWQITAGETSGSWSYDKLQGGGGGFSNMMLWARGDGQSIPEPAPIVVLALAIFGLVIRRRKNTTKLKIV